MSSNNVIRDCRFKSIGQKHEHSCYCSLYSPPVNFAFLKFRAFSLELLSIIEADDGGDLSPEKDIDIGIMPPSTVNEDLTNDD